MVVANHAMSERRVDPGQAVADHRRSQVPHVHRLGDIGRREVDDDRLCPRGRLQAKRLVSQKLRKRRGDPRVVRAED